MPDKSCITNNKNLTDKYDLDKVKRDLHDGRFWQKFMVHKSPEDGYCFIWSIMTSSNKQIQSETSIDKRYILNAIHKEATSHIETYIPFMKNMCVYRFHKGLTDYIENGSYNSRVGDIIPLITANALNQNILIITNEGDGINNHLIKAHRCGKSDFIPVYKKGNHYDSIVPVPKAGLFDNCKLDCPDANKIVMSNDNLSDTNVLGVNASKYDEDTYMRPRTVNNDISGASYPAILETNSHKCVNVPTYTNANVEQEVFDYDVTPVSEVDCSTTSVMLPSTSAFGGLCKSVASKPILCHDNVHQLVSTTGKLILNDIKQTSRPKDRLKICCWNINGLTSEKLNNYILGMFLSTFDIILLTETWSDESEKFALDGYDYYDIARGTRHVNAKRGSGGLGVFISNEIRKGVVKHSKYKDIIAWLILRKDYFGLDRDIYIAIVYLVPENSTNINDDLFILLQKEIAKLPDNCDILVCGDLNARTNTLADYSIENYDGNDGNLANLLCNDYSQHNKILSDMQKSGILTRHSEDRDKANKYGLQLLDLCKSSNLFIMNGRIGQDKGIGKYTRIDTTGNSLVDYVIGSLNMFRVIADFSIGGKLPESDHLPLEFSLHINGVQASKGRKQMDSTWSPIYKYVCSDINDMNHTMLALHDNTSDYHYNIYRDSIRQLKGTDCVAQSFSYFVKQACDRSLVSKRVNPSRPTGPTWFDRECRQSRSIAIRAGERLETVKDRERAVQKCREYRSFKQKKKRIYENNVRQQIENAYFNNKSNMWKILSNYGRSESKNNSPCGDEFLSYFKTLSIQPHLEYFTDDYEREAINFLRNYDNGNLGTVSSDLLELENFNRNFTVEEINSAINSLKNNKAPGNDQIPAEIVKHCKNILASDITDVLNYIIENREFPDIWTEGVRTPIFKTGASDMPENYRGITVLPVFEKIFEITIQKRMEFTYEAFGKVDKYNGGFLKGSRTSDNVFILKGLIERQLILGKPLLVCFVDFSRAFDVINRDILFYKVIKSGLHGRVLDTLRSLYSKTKYRVKYQGRLSETTNQMCGVNQGGNASPTLFRRYMADLREYLFEHCGICMTEDEIIMHLLWADDLILIADGQAGMQKQLSGLELFCAKNHTAVNEIKTKFMVFGQQTQTCITFNNKPIEQVSDYKYLGNILQSIRAINGDIFKNHYDYVSDKARKAVFSILKKTRKMGALPPKCMFHIYGTLVQPILLYGSDIWGISQRGRQIVDKIFMWYSRLILGVKASTSNNIVLGECGQLPPSVLCKINTLKYFIRVNNSPESTIAKQIFTELQRLHGLGFQTWYSKVWELAQVHDVDITMPNNAANRNNIKNSIVSAFKITWFNSLQDILTNPILRTYNRIKSEYQIEPYLEKVKDHRYRNALTRLRASSHTLEIERGRYTNPVTEIENRLCPNCKDKVETEEHFLMECTLYREERNELFNKINTNHPNFGNMSSQSKFTFLLTNDNPQYLSWAGKFIYMSFGKRSAFTLNTSSNVFNAIGQAGVRHGR